MNISYLFSESDCILHGYVKKLGGPWTSSWQMRYAKLYPNRLELHPDSAKPELIFMDQIEEVSPDLVQVKNEDCIVVRLREGKVVLTNPVSKKRKICITVKIVQIIQEPSTNSSLTQAHSRRLLPDLSLFQW